MPASKSHELDEAFSFGRRAADQGGSLSDCPYVRKDMQKSWKSGYRTRINERVQANMKAVTANSK